MSDLPDLDVSRDPDDNAILAIAAAAGAAGAAGAAYLVNGDKSDLVRIARYGGVRIITPREFVRVLGQKTRGRGWLIFR